MLGPSLMNQNELSLEVANAEYTFCFEVMQDYCRITVFYLMEHCVMQQNDFSFEVLYAVIARILFSLCWDIL